MILAILYSISLLWQAAVPPREEAEPLPYAELGYEEKRFNTSYVHNIDIQASAADWEGLKKDALSKECIDGTVTINGEMRNILGC